MATVVGVAFLASFILAPRRGLVATARRRARQRWEFAQKMLTAHLFNHEGLPEQMEESRLEHLDSSLGWEGAFRSQVVSRAKRHGLVAQEDGVLLLTDLGREFARRALVT
jgi:manganese/zinc/iron transport system permease protein